MTQKQAENFSRTENELKRAKRILRQWAVKGYALTAPDDEVWDPPTEDEAWAEAREPMRQLALQRARDTQ